MIRRLMPYFMSLGWGMCLILTVFYIHGAQSSATLLSPWQVIPASVVYLTVVSLFLLGSLLAFSRFPAWLLVIFVSVQTLVMHSYLPLSQVFFYGADGWRHIASVERIWQGLPLTDAATITAGRSWLQYLNPGVVAYSHLWGLLLVARMLGFSFISTMAWLVPLLWSLVVPLTMYKIGKEFEWSDRAALAFSFGSLIPFALVAGGSFTLPNSLGFIVFLPSLILLVRRLRTGERRWVKWLAVYGFYLLSGYTLYAVIFWLLWGSAEVLLVLSLRGAKRRSNLVSRGEGLLTKRLLRPDNIGTRNDKLVAVLLFTAITFCIPTLELAAGYSQLPASPLLILSGAKQFVGNLTGFYLAFGPRPHAIATGNILLNQTPSYAFVANILTDGRYWLLLISSGLWALVLLALVRGWRSTDVRLRWLALVTVGLFGSYFFGRYILVGEHILSRRLDILLAFLSLAVLVADGSKRFQALSAVSWYRWYLVGVMLLVSAFGAAVYSLGPNDQAASADEYNAAQYIWQYEQNSPMPKRCVVADTYPLLTLEALSAKRIVGGGFPIDQYFGQQELQKVYGSLNQDFSTSTWQQAVTATGAERCWFIGALERRKPVADFMGMFGGLGVWRFQDLKK